MAGMNDKIIDGAKVTVKTINNEAIQQAADNILNNVSSGGTALPDFGHPTLNPTKPITSIEALYSTNPNAYNKVSGILHGKIEQMHFAPDGGYESYKLSSGSGKSDGERLHQKSFEYDGTKIGYYPKTGKWDSGYGGNGSTRDTGGRIKYDYTITIQRDILKAIQKEKENLNVPSAYSRIQLNKLFHTKFNRFRVQYQDYFLNGTIGFVVFTRPDLNLYESPFAKIHTQIFNDPVMAYVMQANPETPKLLTKHFTGAHHFNPLLSNTVMSLDVSDESIDTLETGETFTGFKTQYAKSNIRSMTAGSITINFPETYNMAITHLHQIWCGYESGVYRGTLKPKDEYIWRRELDYACDIYYFLLDVEDMIIRYWCKYTGCFPLNVNKSVFSYSGDSPVQHPSLSVTYAYFAREDMSLTNLHEFNNNAGGLLSNLRYQPPYIPKLGSSGNTWSGVPFVQQIAVKTGFVPDARLYVLRFAQDNQNIIDYLLSSASSVSNTLRTSAENYLRGTTDAALGKVRESLKSS